MCYRDEQSGELSGLSRVRSFTQDDAHVFCRVSQARDEYLKVWDIIQKFYAAFGFVLRVRLSLHDPSQPEKYLGDESQWQTAEEILRTIVTEKNADWFEGVGEAAFYGPKLDFMAKERFDLACINEKGEKERIIMIHAAIMGSLDRFISILIEHTAGVLPLWLSPIQVQILPVSEKHIEYANDIIAALKNTHVRAEINDANESLGKKIRTGKTEKIPYLLVVGEKEVEAQTISVESRDHGKFDGMKIAEFIDRVTKEIESKS
jgi:threonyl-tRNA synthetase